jgi:hypothetical protein
LRILFNWVGAKLGDHLEIWDTEWGYSSADALKGAPSNGHIEAARRRQAVLAVREILTVFAVGLPLAVWYDLRDDGPDAANPEDNYGLLDSDGNEKPAMKAVRTLMNSVRGRKYNGMIQETPTGMHALRLEGSTDTIAIVWTDRPGGHQTMEYTKKDLTSATGLLGDVVQSKNVNSGEARVDIDESAGPIYLTWKASAGAVH